ncbi:MAG TPA: hypothetical protein VEU30_06690 [Thermoanaerobaculia bacterium]|nr:hypothetical protein [Thermoanaerobaculia bacterium]
MLRRKPHLIVPVRDRRQRKRYLTLRNTGYALVALVVAFVAITIRSEMEPKNRESFGDLFQRELPQVESKPVEVVREAPLQVQDHTAPDPMLVAPMAREQWLVDDSTTMAPAVAASIEPVAAPNAKSKIMIVGGPEGVSVVEQKRRRPVLSGGFGR